MPSTSDRICSIFLVGHSINLLSLHVFINTFIIYLPVFSCSIFKSNTSICLCLQINNISEIDVFLGPDSNVEKVSEFFSTMKDKVTFYASYIDAAYGMNNAEGSIAYNITDGKLYGKNDEGYVEYKKGCINIRNTYNLQNEENNIDKGK